MDGQDPVPKRAAEHHHGHDAQARQREAPTVGVRWLAPTVATSQSSQNEIQ